MKLPSLKKKKPVSEYFLSFSVSEYEVGAILFQKDQNNLSILSFQEAPLQKEVDLLSTEELIAAADQVVSGLDISMPPDTPLQKTIFALPHDWVEGGKVKPKRLELLKKLCEELELTPIGFLVSAEAIIAHLQAKEGAPLSAVLVEYSKDIVTAYVIKSGNILDIKQGRVEGTVPQTVEKLLSQVMSVDVLPSKIILQDHDGVNKLHQEFLSYHWTQRLPFLHVPQVEVFEKDLERDAIVGGVSTQMGIDIVPEIPKPSRTHRGVVVPVDDTTEMADASDEMDAELPTEEPTAKPAGHDLGFFEDQDVADMPETLTPPPTPEPPVQSAAAIHSDSLHLQHQAPNRHAQQDQFNEDESEEYEEEEQAVKAGSGLVASILALPSKLSIPSIPSFAKLPAVPGGTRLLIPAVAVVVLLIGFVYAYYKVLLKANVLLVADQKTINEEVEVTMSQDAETSADDKTLKLYATAVEVDGSSSRETTGEEETGKKATGTITFYNKTEQKKTFSKGTTVAGSNNLEFELLDEISIASTSAFSTSYSSAKGKVEAKKFGKEYNLPSNTNFTIDGAPSSNFFGKNDEAFAGGSKEVIQVVSSKDLVALEDEVTKSLQEEARKQAEQKADQDTVLLTGVLGASISKKDFDKKEKDRANSVKLNAKVAYDFGYYRESDIEKFATDFADDEIPDGYSIKSDKSEFEIKDLEVDEKSGEATAVLGMQAVYLPSIPTDEIVTQISGKNIEKATTEIKDKDGINDAQITFSRSLPFMPKFLPFNAKNITVTVQDET